VTDTLGAYDADDLQFLSMHDISDLLDELPGRLKDLLIDFCRAARRHYDRPTLAEKAAKRVKTTRVNMYLV
jgi:hypothetical protein